MKESQSSRDDKKLHKTSIGGQAVIEGVMMRGPAQIATSVRKSSGEIVTDLRPLPASRKNRFVKLPLVRGCVGFFDSMIVGVKSLMYSAEIFEVEEEEEGAPAKEPGRFEQWLDKKLSGERAKQAVIYASVAFSLLVGIGLFMLLPAFAVSFVKSFVEIPWLSTLAEGVIRLALFLIYLALVSRMKDIQRVFEYHGAEHKTIFCYEKGLSLTPENVKAQSRLHPRCGTSFLLIVMVISILVFSFISWGGGGVLTWGDRLAAMGMRLLLLPVVAGLSYEVIKLAGRHDNPLTRAVSAPGMWLQLLTTREPDEAQIEVAISALQAVKPENKEDDRW